MNKHSLYRSAVALALAALLAGCADVPASSAPGPAQSAPASQTAPSAAAPSSSSAEPAPLPAAAPAGFVWTVAPEIRAADILPLTYGRPVKEAGGYGALGLVSGWPLAAIRLEEDPESISWGLIDFDGALQTDCAYYRPFVGFDGRLSLSNASGENGYYEWEYLTDGTLAPINTPEITGTSVSGDYLWRADEQLLYIGSGQDGFYVAGTQSYNDMADPAYTGLAWYADAPIPSAGPYGYGDRVIVLQDGRPVGEAIPCDEFATVNFSCGVAGVCQDGLWGLLNTDGTRRLPCAYDRMFPATEDTVVLYENGRPGLYSLAADAWLIEPGSSALEELRPMAGGRLFARAGGLWGVLAAE